MRTFLKERVWNGVNILPFTFYSSILSVEIFVYICICMHKINTGMPFWVAGDLTSCFEPKYTAVNKCLPKGFGHCCFLKPEKSKTSNPLTLTSGQSVSWRKGRGNLDEGTLVTRRHVPCHSSNAPSAFSCCGLLLLRFPHLVTWSLSAQRVACYRGGRMFVGTDPGDTARPDAIGRWSERLKEWTSEGGMRRRGTTNAIPFSSPSSVDLCAMPRHRIRSVVFIPGPGEPQGVLAFIVTQHWISQWKQFITQLAHLTWFVDLNWDTLLLSGTMNDDHWSTVGIHTLRDHFIR